MNLETDMQVCRFQELSVAEALIHFWNLGSPKTSLLQIYVSISGPERLKWEKVLPYLSILVFLKLK